MSLSTEGRLTVAEAAELGSDSEELSPETAPLFRTVITITQPAMSLEHAESLSGFFTDNPYVEMGTLLGFIDVEVSTPEPVEA